MNYGLWNTQNFENIEAKQPNVSGNKQILVARCYALDQVIDEWKNVVSSADTVDESDV